jgi:hypothetical protein
METSVFDVESSFEAKVRCERIDLGGVRCDYFNIWGVANAA